MIRRWLYYASLGALDLVRLWFTTQYHILIVAGICLPVLLLLGLKRGHVDALRHDLLTSPTGREIIFHSAGEGEILTLERAEHLRDELPAVDLLIPEAHIDVTLQPPGQRDSGSLVTLFPTRRGDAKLEQLGAELPEPGHPGIVLGSAAASRAGVEVGGIVRAILAREDTQGIEPAQIDLVVHSVITPEKPQALIGFVDVGVLDHFRHWMQGGAVPEFGWSAGRRSARDGYSCYFLFCRAGKELTEGDKRYLQEEKGLIACPVTGSLPPPLESLFDPAKRKSFSVYELASESSKKVDRLNLLHYTPSQLTAFRDDQDAVLPWNEPAMAEIEGQHWNLVGLSLSNLSWLRNCLCDPEIPFGFDGKGVRARVVKRSDEVVPDVLRWPVKGNELFRMRVEPRPLSSGLLPHQGSARIAVVPADVTARLASHRAGLIDFNPSAQVFVARPDPVVYDKGRLYAHTIDDVPAVVHALEERHFGYESQNALISEIHRQDHSLQLLVTVVGSVVLLFGVLIVVYVLLDSTDRKRATIGILRVMGVSRFGIFLLVFVRAGVIGILAAVLTAGLGYAVSIALNWAPAEGNWLASWKPAVAVDLAPSDLIVILIGSLLCCGLGGIWPAWRASRTDPYDAIIEGRFR